MILNRGSIQLVLLHFLGIDVANGEFKTMSGGVTSIYSVRSILFPPCNLRQKIS